MSDITSGDGSVETTASEASTARPIGLSHTDADQNYATVDFGIDMDLGGVIYVFESGSSRGTFGTYATGDKLRVAVEGGVVKYQKNGTTFYTSSVSPSYPLLVDTSLYSNGATLTNAIVSWNLSSGGSSSANINWLVTDQLGTPRMIFDQSGALATTKRHDYLPFGEEIYNGLRSMLPGYASDNIRQKFTQKERDTETNLDYFGARYYGNTQGRFTSADPLLSSGRSSNPQTWNKYSYTLGNPLKFVDPNGLFEWDASLRDNPSSSDKERSRREHLRDAFTNARKKAESDAAKAHDAGKLSDKKFKAINDALNAYGAENEKNGVTVGVGTPNNQSGSTSPQFAINEKWNGVTATIAVKFDAGFLMSDKAEIGVAHEGAHVEDAFAFAGAFGELVHSGTMLTDPRNMRQWDTENHAFNVQSYLFEAMGTNDNRWGTWQTKWAKLDAQQDEKRQAAVTKIIRDAYGWTPEDKGWDENSRACRPCQ